MLAPLNIEQLQERFSLAGHPYWWAYETSGKKQMVEKFHHDDDSLSEEDLLEYSWLQLEEFLTSHPYGKLRIVLKKNRNDNTEKSPSYTVAWGEMPISGGRRNGYSYNGGGVGNSMGGSNWQMMLYFLQEQSKNNAALQQAMMDQMQLQIENQQLKDALEADNAPTMQEELLKEGIGVVKTWVASNAMRQPVQVGTIGQRSEENNEQATSPPPANENFSIDGAMGYVQAITDLYPQYSRMDVLAAFYNLALQNTEFIGAQLAQVINAQNGGS